MVLKHNVVWQICGCGVYLYPPTEVSVIGQEDYEEVFEAPTSEPEHVLTGEELAELNKDRAGWGLPPLTRDEWIAEYRSWATDFRVEK